MLHANRYVCITNLQSHNIKVHSLELNCTTVLELATPPSPHTHKTPTKKWHGCIHIPMEKARRALRAAHNSCFPMASVKSWMPSYSLHAAPATFLMHA